jgi:molybdopterin molybdotransferase
MAQLSDDCFALDDAPLPVEAAATLIAQRVAPLGGEEQVALPAAHGRVLARDIAAPMPLPPFANAAVDGYAFRHADLDAAAAATPLRLSGRLAAGQAAAAAPLPPGTALRIFTGAPIPPGADTVLMQEDARFAGAALLVPRGLAAGANARPAGEDVPLGALALPGGRRLRTPEIGLAAALGLASLPVRPRLRVGVFSTGDELVSPGGVLGPAQSHDSNRFTLLALLAGLPVAATDLGILPDDAAATRAALAAAAGTQDLLLTSGGVSMGEEDHVRAAIEATGRLVFWKLAVKPGRPAALGVVRGTPVLGLPGNPVAAMVNFLLLARPLVLRLAGAAAEPLPRFPARADFLHRKKPGRREYLRVRIVPGETPLPLARKTLRDGAGVLSTLADCDAFAELPEDATTILPGEVLRVLPFAGLF